MSVFDTEVYIKYRDARINCLHKFFPKEYFKDTKILDLGSGLGHIGDYFQKLGANVTCVDGREQNIILGKLKFPDLNFIHLNIEESVPNEYFDIIIHFGLLYHLNIDLDKHFSQFNSNILILETIVSELDRTYKIQEASGEDQSLVGTGSRFTETDIEESLEKNKFIYNKILDGDLNHHNRLYDWTSSKEANKEYRRMWICKK